MRKVLAFILISISAYATDNAGIYLKTKLSITETKLKQYAPKATVSSETNENGTQFIISWPDVKVTLNTSNVWPDRDVQLKGMYNWISSIQTGSNDTKALLKQIPQLQNIAGTVIEPGYDKAGKVAALVKAIAKDHSGVIFSHQSFYSKDGKWLAGDPADTQQL